jgi:hypothetical protein
MAERVLYLINSLAEGGAEKGLAALIEGGAFEGLELKVAVLAEGGGAYRARLEALGVRPENLSGADRLTLPGLLRAALALCGLLDRWRPRAMILSLPQANLLGRIAALGRPILVASFEHNTRLAKPAYEWGFRLTSPRVDWLVADADRTALEARRRLYWSKPLSTWVLPLAGFGPHPPARPVTAAGTGAPFQIVTAGRLTAAKNHGALIAAVAILVQDRLKPVALTIYGEGPLRPALERQIAEAGLGDRVRLAGFRPDWAGDPGDLFVLPSVHEGLSLATLEAMHAGIPVLASRVGGLHDYGQAAITLDPADLSPERLAQAIGALMDDPGRRAILQADGQRLVGERFGLEVVTARYRDFNRALRARLGAE